MEGNRKMKIYRVWSNSMHKIQYTYGYFMKKETAEKVFKSCGIGTTASGPEAGIEEIEVYEE